MNAAATTNQLSYKQLQAALKSYKDQGLTSIKLNGKQPVLQEEFDRITNATVKDEQPVTNSATASNYPFCSNTVKVENKPTFERSETTVNDKLFTTRVIPAMNSKYAPSWLCKPYTVYIIDGVDYLEHELEAQLQGQTCELPAAANERKLAANLPPRLQQQARKDRVSKARPVTAPIVNVSQELPKVKCEYSKEPASPYFIDTAKAAKYSKSLGDVEKQAARNLEDGIKYASSATKRVVGAVIDFGKGFHKAQVERAMKAA
ncbi:MAG: hypothetical protein KME05_12235 [Gloeocapsa sp. UFS-A4-WI-NPMV-4B04]|jgi:hypothetical protein|nr:hypothetical protein [Gloeocapsa sp. UFS-A4-WI-NPMV-4B04]